MLYFEDLAQGQRFSIGTVTLSREEIVAFAREWDPQPFHLDDDAARDSIFGELVASGLHTLAVVLRDYVRQFDVAALAGFGFERVTFQRPVLPDQRYELELRVLDTAPWKRDGSRGVATLALELTDNDGQLVFDMTLRVLVARVSSVDV